MVDRQIRLAAVEQERPGSGGGKYWCEMAEKISK
jgi:hypothetical protein